MSNLVFRGREIVVSPQIKDNTSGYDTGKKENIVAEILYVGKGCKLGYSVGDTIVYPPGPLAQNIIVESIELIRMPEDYVICSI